MYDLTEEDFFEINKAQRLEAFRIMASLPRSYFKGKPSRPTATEVQMDWNERVKVASKALLEPLKPPLVLLSWDHFFGMLGSVIW